MQKTIGSKMWQRDVNTYIFLGEDGKIKHKGAPTKYDRFASVTPKILSDALLYYFTKGVKPEDTIINPDNNIIDYQYITKGGPMFKTY